MKIEHNMSLAAAAAILVQGLAVAQSDPTAPAGAPSQTATAAAAPRGSARETIPVLEEVIVYSQLRGRGESLQTVPIAITALDQAVIDSTHSVSISQIGALAPNVQTSTVGTTPGVPNFSIRGIGVNSSIRSVDPAINIIQDGMVLAYPAGAVQNTFDLDSIEVLRGPQGVLFGRNATGGAVVLRTRAPTATPQVLVDLSYGLFNTIQANASIEGPLSGENVLAKLAVLYQRSDGFVKNTNHGIFAPAPGNPAGAPVLHPAGRAGSLDELTVKPMFLFRFNDDHSLTLYSQYQRYNDGASTPRNYVPSTGPAVPLQTAYGFTPANNGYDINTRDDGYLDLRAGHVIAQLDDQIGAAKLTTIASWRQIDFDSTVNLTGSPFVLFYFPDNRESNRQWSIESRLNFPIADFLEGLVGVYYLDSQTDVLEKRLQGNAAGVANANTYIKGQFTQSTKAAAVFANLDWRLTDAITLSTGGRFSTEEKDFTGSPLLACVGQSFDNCPTNFTTVNKRWHDFSPRVVLDWQITPGTLGYVSYTEGFRSGNFNSRTTTTAGFVPASPEYVTSYEMGLKNDLFDRRVRLNLAGFYEDYGDIQQVLTANFVGVGPVQTLLNAASARIQGGELEFTAKPWKGWEFNTNFGYTDAKFQKFTVPVPGVADPTQLQFARIPKYTVLAAANYRWKMASLPGEFNIRTSYNWRSKFNADLQNTPELLTDAYGLVDANIGYDTGDWSVSLWGRNLANEVYADVKGRNLAYVAWGGEPRTYGIRFTAKFR